MGLARSTFVAVFEVGIPVPKTLQLAYVQISSKSGSLSTSPWSHFQHLLLLTSTLTYILLTTNVQEFSLIRNYLVKSRRSDIKIIIRVYHFLQPPK